MRAEPTTASPWPPATGWDQSLGLHSVRASDDEVVAEYARDGERRAGSTGVKHG
jgi:hypothetical protein